MLYSLFGSIKQYTVSRVDVKLKRAIYFGPIQFPYLGGGASLQLFPVVSFCKQHAGLGQRPNRERQETFLKYYNRGFKVC